MQTALEVSRGTPHVEAERAARLRLGATDVTSEAYRDQQGVPAIDTILQDIRYAARALRRDSRFSVMAMLTLTLGIGATTTIFSLVRGVLLDPLPFPESDRPPYTTVQTTVYRLEEKGVIRRVRKIGNAHIFEAGITRQEARGSLIDDLLRLFGGQSEYRDYVDPELRRRPSQAPARGPASAPRRST